MRQIIRAIMQKYGETTLWVTEFVSGLSLISCAMFSWFLHPAEFNPETAAVSILVRPNFWFGFVMLVGLAQIGCAALRNSLCAVFTAYPAAFACLFSGIYGCLLSRTIEPVAIIAFIMGIVNYFVVRQNWHRARGRTRG